MNDASKNMQLGTEKKKKPVRSTKFHVLSFPKLCTIPPHKRTKLFFKKK